MLSVPGPSEGPWLGSGTLACLTSALSESSGHAEAGGLCLPCTVRSTSSVECQQLAKPPYVH